MSCETCGHTLKQVARVAWWPIFWCPRCGSVKGPGTAGTEPPALTQRVRDSNSRPLCMSNEHAVPAQTWLAICEAAGVGVLADTGPAVGLRDADEVQQAHDIFWAVVTGAVPSPFDEDDAMRTFLAEEGYELKKADTLFTAADGHTVTPES